MDKISSRLNGYLHNINYKSKSVAQLERNSQQRFAPPVWILGVLYTPDGLLRDVENSLDEFTDGHGTSLLNDISSRLWFTYRQGFMPLQRTLTKHGESDTVHKSSDTGWGCVIRVTQMFVAHMLVLKLMGRAWRKNTRTIDARSLRCRISECNHLYQEILEMFVDIPGQAFSVHTICELISRELKSQNWQPGDWIGPATAANIIKHGIYLANSSSPLGMHLDDIRVYIARDALIDEEELYPNEDSHGHTMVVLIPLRLGASEFNLEYKNCILKLFCFDNFLGIIGGKPRKSFYFIGAQGDDLIYLDPHYTQKAARSTAHIKPDTYHCKKPKTVNIAKIDPSCTIGFIFHQKSYFDDFKQICEDSSLFHRTVDRPGANNVSSSSNSAPQKSILSCPMVVFGKRQSERITNVYTLDDMCVIDDFSERTEDTLEEDVGYVLI